MGEEIESANKKAATGARAKAKARYTQATASVADGPKPANGSQAEVKVGYTQAAESVADSPKPANGSRAKVKAGDTQAAESVADSSKRQRIECALSPAPWAKPKGRPR